MSPSRAAWDKQAEESVLRVIELTRSTYNAPFRTFLRLLVCDAQ